MEPPAAPRIPYSKGSVRECYHGAPTADRTGDGCVDGKYTTFSEIVPSTQSLSSKVGPIPVLTEGN